MTNSVQFKTKRRRSEDGPISKMTKPLTQTDLQSLIPCAVVSNKEDKPSTLKEKEKGHPQPWWEQTTNDLVHLSTFPFLILSLPQLIRNAVNLQNGNLAALSVLSWKVSPAPRTGLIILGLHDGACREFNSLELFPQEGRKGRCACAGDRSDQ